MLNIIYNLSVSKKLMLFALVPTVTIMFFALDSISRQYTLRKHNLITHDFILTAMNLVNVVSELQNERGFDLTISQAKDSRFTAVFLTNQQRKTDNAITDYFDFLHSIKSSPKEWQRKKEFRQLHDELNTIDDIRLREKNINGFKLYSKLINSALSILQSLQTSSDNAVLASKTSLYSTLLLLQDYYAQERGLINAIFIKSKVSIIHSHTINSIINKQKELLNYFTSIAPVNYKNRVHNILNSSNHHQIELLKQSIIHRAEHSGLLNRLQAFFGYGGLIHSYKNYLLRTVTRELYAFNFAAKEASNIIQEMRRLKSIGISELNHLDTLQTVIDKYKNKMHLMQKLKQSHLSIQQIDAQTSVNDFPALTALNALLEGEIKIDDKIWWEKTSHQLIAFEAISNEIQESIRSLSAQNVDNASNQFFNHILLMAFALFIIIILTYIILKRLVIDVSAISTRMNHMVTTGDYNSTLEVYGRDEIAIMAKSFNALLTNINSSQKQLLGQKTAMDEHSIVATTDLKGTITYVNQKFCDISGYKKEELIGKNHRILNSNNQSKDYWRNMFLTVSKGGVWNDEVMNIAKDGHTYWVDTTIVPVTWNTKESRNSNSNSNSNSNKGYIAIRTDISKRKQQENNLLEAKIAAEAATVAKSQFLATMSHEIRTPMNGVIGMAQLLEETPLNDEQKDYLSTITRSGTNLLSIINDILDFSKLDAEMVEIESIAFNLEVLCHETLSLVAGNAVDKKLEFILDYEPDSPRYFVGDPSRIKQVLLNFLGNSVKFTKKGFIRLGISCYKNNNQKTTLNIEVQDTGIGLKPKAIKTLFNEFTQADSSTTREFGGTGLGLAITKKIVRLMNSEIIVESTFGEGSIFSIQITLPLAAEPQATNNISLQGIRILFVDDNEENQRVFEDLFNHMGAKTTVVINPLETESLAIKAIKEGNPYQIIVLDHNMPDINGEELGALLRKNSALNDSKLLIFSSLGQKGDASLFSQIGFNAYLNKISRYDTIKSILSAMLSHQLGQPILTQYSIQDTEPALDQKTTHFNAKILLVEDVIPNQIIAKKFLTKMGLNVDIANNGQEAVDAINQKTYDLVFMDCRMPVMDGYEATQLIRQQEESEHADNHLTIVALTANASIEDKTLCQEAGMDDMVTKPFRRTDLSDCLQKWLTSSIEHQTEEIAELNTSKTDPVILDKAVYQQLKDDMGEDFDEIKNAIIDSIQSNITLLEERDKNTATKDLIRFAHSIKSPAANLGMMHLAQLTSTLESTLRSDQFDTLEQATIDIKDALNQAKQVLL